jgi:ankyrin repeat protein
MKEDIKQVLQTVIKQFGESIFSNPNQFKSVINDIPIDTDADKIRNLLRYAICNLQAYDKLKSAQNENLHLKAENLITEMSTKYMMDKGATRSVITSMAELLGYKEDFSKTFESLIEASQDGTLEHVKYFIEQKDANIHEKDKDGWTPLMRAAKLNGDPEVLKYLVSKGSDITIRSNSGRSLLHASAQANENVEIIKYIVSLKLDVNIRNNDGDTPLHDAANWNKNVEVIKYLISQGADVNSKNNDKRTPLHNAAAHNKNIEIIKYLVSHGADLLAKNSTNWTPLHDACCSNQNVEIINFLISQGIDVNIKGNNEATPLHLAAHLNPNIEVLKTLLYHGADVNAKAYGDDAVSTFTASNMADTDEKRDLLFKATPSQPASNSIETELPIIEKTISTLEIELQNGTITVDNNIRRMKALAPDELIMKKMQEKDYVWLEKYKSDLLEIGGGTKYDVMLTLSRLYRTYPNDSRILNLGKRGIPVFIKIFSITRAVQEKLGHPLPEAQIEMIDHWVDDWKKDFGYVDEANLARKESSDAKQIYSSKNNQESELAQWKEKGLCSFCGGQLGGFLTKKCKSCGKPKNY